MIRNAKGFGLAVMAVCLLGAIVAQGASAKSALTIPAPVPPTVSITGDGHNTPTHLRANGSTVTCNTTTYSAKDTSGTGSISEMTVAPTYSACTAFGFATAHVKTNSCTFTFTTPSTLIKAGEPTWHGADLHLLCPSGKSIEITPTAFGASVCTQFLSPQTPTGGHVVGTNAGTTAEMDVTLDITLTGIHYTGTGGACGNAETHSDAELEGNSTVRCYKSEVHTTENQINCTFS